MHFCKSVWVWMASFCAPMIRMMIVAVESQTLLQKCMHHVHFPPGGRSMGNPRLICGRQQNVAGGLQLAQRFFCVQLQMELFQSRRRDLLLLFHTHAV